MYDIGDIYEFPLLRCPGLVTPVNEEHLRENMQYWELRLHRMRFAEYPWTERKLYWLNEGGSHHLQLPVIRHAVWEFLFRLRAD